MVDREAMLIRRVEREVRTMNHEAEGMTTEGAQKLAALEVEIMIDKGEIK